MARDQTPLSILVENQAAFGPVYRYLERQSHQLLGGEWRRIHAIDDRNDEQKALPSLRSQKPTWRKAAELAREWQLKQLAGRLEELGL